MVDSSLLIALVGVGGTILASSIGAYVNLRSTQIREENQNMRTIAEHYTNKKINSLIDLYALNNKISSEVVQFILNEIWEDKGLEILSDTREGVTMEEYKNYEDMVEEYQRLSDKCRVFLDDDKSEQIVKTNLMITIALDHAYQDEDTGLIKIDIDALKKDDVIQQKGYELQGFRKYTRLVEELIEEELNDPIKDLYDSKDE